MAAKITISSGRRGFTLLELLIVVILLGILSAIAIPMFVDQSDSVGHAAFISSLKAMESSFQQYFALNLAYPRDVARGTRPSEMAEYFNTSTWTQETPIGGKWDYEGNVLRITAGISVVDSGKSAEYMAEIDQKFDNGNLGSGRFRAMSTSRYTFVLAD